MSTEITNSNSSLQARKRLAPFAVLAAAALLAAVAGCGTPASSPSIQTNQTNSTSSTNSTTTPAQVSYPLTLTDDNKSAVTIAKKPQHIASATLGTDEILSGLVGKKNVSMVTQYATDPQQSNITDWVQGVPQLQKANAEQILAVNPDLVLVATYTEPGVVDQMRQANLPVYEFANFDSIASIAKHIQVVGQLVGEPTKAKAMVDSMETTLQKIKTAVNGQKQMSVLDYNPAYGSVAGKNTTTDDQITHAGAINAAAAAGINGWPTVTKEQIVSMNPDVMIVAQGGGDKDKLLADPALQTVNAIKNKKIIEVKPADLSSVSQFVVRGVVDIAKGLYPNVTIPQ
ncbi:MAG: periplasmic binding protein [Bacilli bacterium]|nr:periplasmic binding protein [Bacilli bacterium]